MKTLDRYIVRTFLSTAVLFLVVMIMLRIVLDLFVNIDEFTEQSKPFLTIIGDIWAFYAVRSLVYFIELGGLIIVASAGFSLARMNHTNELTAMLASGVSLHRVVLPIIICSMLMGGLIIVDQELMVPQVAHLLIRNHDDARTGDTKELAVPIMTDTRNTGWYSSRFSSENNVRIMHRPVVILRNGDSIPVGRAATESGGRAEYAKFGNSAGWHITKANLARLSVDNQPPWPSAPSTREIWTRMDPRTILTKLASGASATPGRQIDGMQDVRCGLVLSAKKLHTYSPRPGQPKTRHVLESPRFVYRDAKGRTLGVIYAPSAEWEASTVIPVLRGRWILNQGTLFIESDLSPQAIVLRQSAAWISYMSTFQLTQLLQFKKIPGERAAVLTLHTRVASPINNLVMLLLGLPFILSRQRNLKKSVGLNLLIVGAFYLFIYGCRYLGVAPMWGAWLPVMVFGPPAVLMFDSVKT